MPRNKWNITKNEGIKYIYKLLIKILEENNNKIEYSKLNKLINIKSQNFNITFNSKKKNISDFIKYHCENLDNIIDNYSDICIFYSNNKKYIINYNILKQEEWIIL